MASREGAAAARQGVGGAAASSAPSPAAPGTCPGLLREQRYSFHVLGIPAPQGSKRHVGRGILVESSARLKPWRDSIAAEAFAQRAGAPALDGPLYLTATFTLPRPKSAAKRVRTPWRKPDLDKLLRAVMDGIGTGGIWQDDARVVEVCARKVFPDGGRNALDVPGVVIEVGTIEGWADEVGYKIVAPA